MNRTTFLALATATVACLLSVVLSGDEAHARYQGSGPACVTGVASGDRLNVRSQPSARSRILGSLAPGACGMGIEAVEGNWTFIRGSDRGRNVKGWVNNRFLRAKGEVQSQGGAGQGGAGQGGAGQDVRTRQVSYSCNEGIPLVVTFVEEPSRSYAIYTHDGGPGIRVAAQVSGSGFSYSDGVNELRGKGGEIYLIEGGDVMDHCFAR